VVEEFVRKRDRGAESKYLSSASRVVKRGSLVEMRRKLERSGCEITRKIGVAVQPQANASCKCGSNSAFPGTKHNRWNYL